MSPEESSLSEVLETRQLVEAVLDGDDQSWKTQLGLVPNKRALDVIGIATTIAIFRKWPQDPSLQEIADYVAGMEARATVVLPVGAAVVESVIRAALGDSEFLKGTPGNDIIMAEILLIKSIQLDVLAGAADRESYLAEVVAAAK